MRIESLQSIKSFHCLCPYEKPFRLTGVTTQYCVIIPYGHVLCPKKIGNANSVYDQEIAGVFTDRCLQRRAIQTTATSAISVSTRRHSSTTDARHHSRSQWFIGEPAVLSEIEWTLARARRSSETPSPNWCRKACIEEQRK